MNSEQLKKKKENIIKTVKCFLKYPNYSMIDIANALGLTKSSVQRYLNDPLIPSLFDLSTAKKVKLLLQHNQLEARKKGGQEYYKNNTPVKNEAGQFVGSKKEEDPLKLIKKMIRIEEIALIYLENKTFTFEDVCNQYNQNHQETITPSYVSLCLSAKTNLYSLTNRLYEEIKREMMVRHDKKLMNNRLQSKGL